MGLPVSPSGMGVVDDWAGYVSLVLGVVFAGAGSREQDSRSSQETA